VINFSAEPQTVTFEHRLHYGAYADYCSGESVELLGATQLQLKPWSYRGFVR
jgi:hypothetical protein